jgi:hypothetical protein
MGALTAFHVALSLLGLLAGFITVIGLLNAKTYGGWTSLFLASTVATSMTGFLFPLHHVTPAISLGIISIGVLTLALYALYSRKLAGAWRLVFLLSAVLALYLNFFVFIVQMFLKVPWLRAVAPTQKEPPFIIAQALALALFAGISISASRRFRPPAGQAAKS